MKPLNRSFAAALIVAAACHPAWLQQAGAATSAAPVGSTQTEASPSFTQILTAPFGSDLAELSTPMKYGLLLIGLSLIDKLSRKERR